MSESKHSEAEVIGALKYLQTGRKTEDTFSLHHGTPWLKATLKKCVLALTSNRHRYDLPLLYITWISLHLTQSAAATR